MLRRRNDLHGLNLIRKLFLNADGCLLNRNILMYPIVCATMTKEEKDEKLETSNVLLPFHKLDEVIDCVTLPHLTLI